MQLLAQCLPGILQRPQRSLRTGSISRALRPGLSYPSPMLQFSFTRSLQAADLIEKAPKSRAMVKRAERGPLDSYSPEQPFGGTQAACTGASAKAAARRPRNVRPALTNTNHPSFFLGILGKLRVVPERGWQSGGMSPMELTWHWPLRPQPQCFKLHPATAHELCIKLTGIVLPTAMSTTAAFAEGCEKVLESTPARGRHLNL